MIQERNREGLKGKRQEEEEKQSYEEKEDSQREKEDSFNIIHPYTSNYNFYIPYHIIQVNNA